MVQKKIVDVHKVPGTENSADIHTKALKKPTFDKMCEKMNIVELSEDILSTNESKCSFLRQRHSATFDEECETEYVHPHDTSSLYAVLPEYITAIAVLFYNEQGEVFAQRDDSKEARTMRCRSLRQ